MYITNIITSTKDFNSLKQQWNNLLRQSSFPNVFSTWEWAHTWWEVFLARKTLFIIAVERDNKISGLAPFYTTLPSRFLAPRTLLFLGGGEGVVPDYLDIISDQDNARSAINQIASTLSRCRNWDVAYFKNIRPNSLTNRFLIPNLQTMGFPIFSIKKPPSYRINLPDSWDDYLLQLDRAKRRNIRYELRKIKEKGEVQFKVIRDKSELPRAIDELKKLHQLRMKEKGFPGKFSDSSYSQFHTRIINNFFQMGQLSLSFLIFNQEHMAVKYDLSYNNIIYNYQTGFDPAYQTLSVGNVLASLVIKEAIENEVAAYDFLSGGEGYKRRLANQKIDLMDVIIYNTTTAGKLAYHKKRLKRKVKLLTGFIS